MLAQVAELMFSIVILYVISLHDFVNAESRIKVYDSGNEVPKSLYYI